MAPRVSTEALATFSARRPWLVIGIWAALLVASGILVAALLSDVLTTDFGTTSNPESKRAEALLEERLRGPEKDSEVVIVRSPDRTVDDAAFKATVEQIYGQIAALGREVIEASRNYYQTGDESLVSSDRHTTIAPFVMAGDRERAKDNIGRLLELVEATDSRDGFRVLISGEASASEADQTLAEQDLRTAETVGIPAALLLLVLVFGALTAALVPLVLAIVSIVLALGVTALIGQQWELWFFITNMITMMGLAVGIDYSLFILSRYRGERSRGLDKGRAIAAAGATASRAVFFSGMTVVLALLGMLIVPSTAYRSTATGAIIVVLFSVLASLTLLPAILGLLGDRVNALRVPLIGRGSLLRDDERSGGFWDYVTRTVMRHPVVSVLATSGLLIALTVPLLDINTGWAGVSMLPDGLEVKEGFRILEEDFSFGLVTPAEIAIHGEVDSPGVEGAIRHLEGLLASDTSFGPGTLRVNDAEDVALLSVPVHGDPTRDEAISAIKRLRGEYIPVAFAGVEAEALVTGAGAVNLDYRNQISRYTPIVIAFVLGLSFVLLMLVFRSLVVPAKAIIMNLLSVGAAYGVMVLVFQKGVGNEILGLRQVDTIEAWLPLWAFSVLFGLSMDYHVFLLSRIRERYNRTGDYAESVAFGLRASAGIITGAALIMVVVFAGFATGDRVAVQQTGFVLGVAVLLDATIVRSVLVPAAMKLLGDRNWYLPSALRWLPEMQTEHTEAASQTEAGH